MIPKLTRMYEKTKGLRGFYRKYVKTSENLALFVVSANNGHAIFFIDVRMDAMEEKNILITNIQRFSLHDGPGIRTTVFLKGCSIHCPWCSNPETIKPEPEKYLKNGIEGIYGKFYSVSELVKECLKDQKFYDGKLSSRDLWNITRPEQIDQLPGGVTFSGGEALLQMEKLVPVCSLLHYNDIHIAVETCLFVPRSNLSLALDYIDFFYIDMKILNEARCKKVEHGNLNLYLDNLNTLLSWKDKEGNYKPVVIRIPVIGSYTAISENREAVKKLVCKYKDRILKVEMIKEHSLAENKYRSLNMTMDYHGVDDELMENYKTELINLGIMIEVCKI